MATLLAGKTIVNLNYTANAAALTTAIEQAEIRTIYTSRRFIERLERKMLMSLPSYKANISFIWKIYAATFTSMVVLALAGNPCIANPYLETSL